MNNPYRPPEAPISDMGAVGAENNSGGGKSITPPPGVAGWSWGGFVLSWIWAIGNQVWIGLLALIPYVGIVVAIYLGIKGRELAWRNKRWQSVDHFNKVQHKWSVWSLVIFLVFFVLGILAAIAIPAYQRATLSSAGAG